MFVYEVDEKLMLRMLAARDAERLFQMIDESRAYLQEWLPWLDDIKTQADTLTFIKDSFQIYAEQKGVTAGIFYKELLVGVIGFNRIDARNKIGYVGYWLTEDAQGQGIMTRAVTAFIDYSFNELQLNKIDIRAAYDNIQSQAIPERLGFKREGHLRQVEWLYDHYVDHIVYGMLQEDWK